MRTIERTIELSATPDRVWKAITDPTELSRWFPDGAELALQVGGEGVWEWEQYGRFPVRVELVEPPTRFSWSWTHPEGSGVRVGVWTRVDWTLTPRADGGTTLMVRESGFESDDSAAENLRGWSKELAELVEMLEEAA